LRLWPLSPYRRPRPEKVLLWSSKKPTLKNLPCCVVHLTCVSLPAFLY
jgi:hypothetical protein